MDGHSFAVGNRITIADFSLAASVATIHESGISIAEYPNVTAWIKRCETQMPGYATENTKGAKICGEFALKTNIKL